MGEVMSINLFKTEVLPTLLAGTARQPLTPKLEFANEPKAALRALSLTGQSLRFDRPTTPPQFAVEPIIEDDRTLLPNTLRRPLLRILNGKLATEHPALAIARVFDQLRLRLHPFDLPQLDTFIRKHADHLGTTAQHWASNKSDAAESIGYYDRDDLDETNWTQGTLGRRAAFFETQRKQDATKARALLEATWSRENADTRARLLQALQINLSGADQPFLETLQKDRSPRVRQLAQRLLSKLGAAGEDSTLKAALERITHTQAGLLRKRPALSLQLPATVKEQTAPKWIRETFSEFTFEQLTRALSLNEAEIIEAAAKDPNLLLALALITTIDNRLDHLETIVEHLPNAWELLSDSGLQDLGAMSHDERLRWADILIRPYARKLPWNYPAWNQLHHLLEGSAPISLIEAALESDWFNEPPSTAKHTQYWMEVTVALCPSSQRQQLRSRLEAFDPTLTATALPLLHLLDALENSEPHA
jgi:hypothetical protein